ncbi:thiamine pyrophosphate-dependent enzyme [Mycobacterium shigaense]|uniref:Dehydrogenase n=1 Tax=Mycobacterium shigaense TaxID=722731 RepID=A0A1Z4ENH6_9MYCO|nr:thiamine pyrophosphate-dependent enzyme [Mycobacterium shigaense]MEA1120490.1 thiamine pyrophosphate-dependent enzyme [Mycobacterium shigaense]BAX94442.1 dehydrogenase [Mycobacterium shigaense]
MTCTTERSAEVMSDQLELYRRMWVLRLVDMALQDLRIDGLIEDPVQAAFGQEAVAIGTTAAMRSGDALTTTIPHIVQANEIALGLPLGPSIAEMIGADLDCGFEETPREAKGSGELWFSASALQRSALRAVGQAYANWLHEEGRVTVCVIGEHEVDSADFAEVVNAAVLWRLPVVFVVENTRLARITWTDRVLHERIGMPVLSIDGNDVEAVRDVVAEALQRASADQGPTLIRTITNRTNDVDKVDPLVFARQQLIDAGVSGSHLYEVERRARYLVAEAEAFAKATLVGQAPESVRQPEAWPAAS